MGEITLRDLFAANAPSEIPRHFMQRPLPIGLPGYRKGMNVSETDELARQFDFHRAIAWRWHWADAMIAAREAPQ